MGHIVVGVDETPQAAAALRWAVEQADTRGWRVTAVLAWGFLAQHRAEPAAPFEPGYTDADAGEALAGIVDRALGPELARRVERRIVCDLPAHALTEAAGDADLLVVGTRDLRGLRRVLSSSVSSACRRHAPCSVVVVHDDGRAEAVTPPSTAA